MLTPRQREALDLDAHTAIVANAGSGKTKALVERYLAILLAHPGYHPKDLVAITFTEQAARDLKRKILEEIERRLTSDAATAQDRRRLNEIRTLLGSAQISTIHAFCNQLLRAYPVEANVDASFGILLPPEDRILLDESIRSVFYRVLHAAYENRSNPEAMFLELFRTLGRRDAADLVRSMLERRPVAGEVARSIQTSTDQEILMRWEKAIESYLTNSLLNLIDVPWYQRCMDALDNKKKAFEASRAFLEFSDAREFRDRIVSALKLLKTFHTNEWNKLASYIVRKEYHDELEKEILPVLKRLRQARSLAESYSAPMRHETGSMYVRLMRSLSALYQEVIDDYSQSKVSLGLLDHDDSLEKALALAGQPEIARELGARYKFILVDEYQDTDPTQYKILERITARLAADTNLMVVGDPKQSIYGFRNAELPLFFETIANVSRAERHKVVELQENFRMLPVPIAFINELFAFIFERLTVAAPLDYLPLIRARKASASGTVELLLAGKDDGGAEVSEAALIAKKILHLVAGGATIEADGKLRPAQYGDIAILLRSRSRQRKIERALHAAHIPFSIYGGMGFYTRQEIVDVTAYLQFLLDPSDDIAIVGILRSPFFGLSDADLIGIAASAPPARKSFWDALVRAASRPDAPRHWIRAHDQIRENQALAGRLSAYQLIDKIYEETNIYGFYAGREGGRQAIANLEKFAAMALAGESAAFFGAFDFVERIEMLAAQDEREAQADIRAGENTVRIMTIHAAKGLEFPIVILPQLERTLVKKDSRNAEALLDPHLGALVPFGDEKKHWVYQLAAHQKQERELDEEKRIFYVAATRARDHLILSAAIGNNKHTPPHSFLQWIDASFGFDSSNTMIASLPVHTSIDEYADGITTRKEIAFDVPIIRALVDVAHQAAMQAIDVPLPEIDLAPVAPSQSQSRYSPTQLLHYIQCPTKYYLRYGLGLPEEPHLSFDFEPADLAESVKGTLLGQLVHAVLEKSDSFIINDNIDLEKFDASLIESLEKLDIYSDRVFAKYKEQILAHVSRFVSSGFGKAVLKSKEFYTELNLRAMLNERQMLSGIIDRLYKNTEGDWEILDYKTDRTEITAKKLDTYRYQMRFYAYLVSRFTPGAANGINARLFFTNVGVLETFAFTGADLSTVGAELNATVAHIRRDQQAASLADIQRNYDHCADCPYYRELEARCIAD